MSRYHTLLLVLAALVAPTAGLVFRDVDQTEAATMPDPQKMINDYFVLMGWENVVSKPEDTTTAPEPTLEDVARLFLQKVKRLREFAWAIVFLFDVGNYANTIHGAIMSINSDTERIASEKQTALEDVTKIIETYKAEHGALATDLEMASNATQEMAMGLKVASISYKVLKMIAAKLPFLVPNAGELIQKTEQELIATKAALEKAEAYMSDQSAKIDESNSAFKAAFSALPALAREVVVTQKIHEIVKYICDLACSIYPTFTDGLQMKEAEKIVQIFNQINEVTHVRDVDFSKTYIGPELQEKIDFQTKKSKMAHAQFR